MSWDEVGKSAKRMGITHHRNVKRIDPTPPPPKPPGKATGKKVRRNFSYTYERRSLHEGKKWHKQQHWTWYATERQRDDAMLKAGGFMRGYYEIRNVLPIDRLPLKPQEKP